MSSISIGPFLNLFLWALVLGAMYHMLHRGNRSLSGVERGEDLNQFWQEHHALVATAQTREKLPWKTRAFEGIKYSMGSNGRNMHTSICRKPFLPVQVDNPFRSMNQFGFMKRSYICLRFEKGRCRGQAMEELWNRRYYKKYDTYEGTFLMTDTTALNRLKRDDKAQYDQIMRQSEGENYISALDGGDAISGNKAKQLEVKRSYAERFGCDYNSLRIQPAQYTMHKPDECKNFWKYADSNPGKMWIKKPILGQGGVGITLHTDTKDFEDLRACKKSTKEDNKYIVQDYIQKPLLIHGKKFDIRVYMLIASSMPYFVFYHPGYLRRAVTDYKQKSTEQSNFLTNTHYQSLVEKFELADHIWGFERFQKYLSDHNVAGARYVSTVLNSAIKKGLLFNFQSARDELVRRRGSYHLFGLDFMIDDELRVHFIEANGYPGFTWSKDFPTRTLVTQMFDMLIELHESPKAFETMTQGDMYGGFELIYNELDDDCNEKMYNPCVDFANFNAVPMKSMAESISRIHDTSRRTKFQASRKIAQDAKEALKACTSRNIDPNSPSCTKLMRDERRQKFQAMFKEIEEWDLINTFVAGM